MAHKLEYRIVTNGELRVSPAGVLSGYAAVYNSASSDLGGYTETVKPGCFDRSLRTLDCVALVNHNASMILGRKQAGTLRLKSDGFGLKYEIDLAAKSSIAQDVRVAVQRGDIDGSSFGFIARKDAWPAADRRELLDCDLLDVSCVTFPAYPATSGTLAARSIMIAGRQVPMGVYRGGRSPAPPAPPEMVDEMERERMHMRLRLARLL